MLTEILESDPSAVLQVGMDDEDRIDYFFCQTTAMQKTLQLYPEILFLDATYK